MRAPGLSSRQMSDRSRERAQAHDLRAETVYRRMRRDLLRGRIRPGTRITEEWAATNYRVSRTPVREACRRLAEEGLLTHRPRRGYSAPVIDAAEISDLYEVRRALEVLAVRLAAAGRGSREPLARQRAVWADGSLEPGETAVFRDEAFHLALARAAGNRALEGILEGVNARIRLVRVHDFFDRARIEATRRQHLAVLDAVEDGDGERAAALLEAHILESQRNVSRAASRALAELWTGTRAPEEPVSRGGRGTVS